VQDRDPTIPVYFFNHTDVCPTIVEYTIAVFVVSVVPENKVTGVWTLPFVKCAIGFDIVIHQIDTIAPLDMRMALKIQLQL
jgi:hypothetical protein